MAQQEVEKMCYQLSKVTFLAINHHGDLQFEIQPEETALQKTVIPMSKANWISFATIARAKILKAITDKEDISFLYHANSKVVKVIWRENGYQVHLMTFSAKGAARRDLCVYLTQEEYEVLEEKVVEVTTLMESRLPNHHSKKYFLLGYKWKYTGHDDSESVPLCLQSYFCKKDAEYAAGLQLLSYGSRDGLKLQVIPDIIAIPDDFELLKKLYLVFLCEICHSMRNLKCTACIDCLDHDDPNHSKGANCMGEATLVFDKYLQEALTIATNKIVKNAFTAIWKLLGLYISNSTLEKNLEKIHSILDDRNTVNLVKQHTLQIYPIMQKDPEIIYMRQFIRENALHYVKEKLCPETDSADDDDDDENVTSKENNSQTKSCVKGDTLDNNNDSTVVNPVKRNLSVNENDTEVFPVVKKAKQ